MKESVYLLMTDESKRIGKKVVDFLDSLDEVEKIIFLDFFKDDIRQRMILQMIHDKREKDKK